jgi:hypothetical protein
MVRAVAVFIDEFFGSKPIMMREEFQPLLEITKGSKLIHQATSIYILQNNY